MNKNSESFNIARHQYIKGYHDKNEHIFPALDLIAKEFSLTLSPLATCFMSQQLEYLNQDDLLIY